MNKDDIGWDECNSWRSH